VGFAAEVTFRGPYDDETVQQRDARMAWWCGQVRLVYSLGCLRRAGGDSQGRADRECRRMEHALAAGL